MYMSCITSDVGARFLSVVCLGHSDLGEWLSIAMATCVICYVIKQISVCVCLQHTAGIIPLVFT